jgi:site-specific recombinase XerD
VRLDDAVTYFLGEWPAEGPTVDTWRSYAGQLKWLVGFTHARGQTQLADCTADVLRAAMQQKMNPRNHSLAFKGGESGAKALLAATRCCFRWLATQKVPVPDISAVRPPRVPERIQPRLWPHEFKAIENTILHRLVSSSRRLPRLAIARDLALVYMLGDTGLRANEVCGMTLSSIDFDAGCVLVMRGKGKKQRALSIVDPEDPAGGATLRLLADWVELRASVQGASRHTMLWVSMRGNPLSRDELRKVLGRICIDAGLASNRPPHTFRRANFTEAYRADPSSMAVLSARMGWSDQSHHMAAVYTRGAELELARTTPVPSLSARWRGESKVPVPRQWPTPMIDRDVGLGRGKS